MPSAKQVADAIKHVRNIKDPAIKLSEAKHWAALLHQDQETFLLDCGIQVAGLSRHARAAHIRKIQGLGERVQATNNAIGALGIAPDDPARIEFILECHAMHWQVKAEEIAKLPYGQRLACAVEYEVNVPTEHRGRFFKECSLPETLLKSEKNKLTYALDETILTELQALAKAATAASAAVGTFAKAVPPPPDIFVAGYAHGDAVRHPHKVVLDAIVDFVAEPDNPHDRSAIRLMLGDLKLGYVPRTETVRFHPHLKDGRAQGYIHTVQPNNPAHRQVLVRLGKPAVPAAVPSVLAPVKRKILV